jgi:tetratricopeptide (TPR) repeat protein
MQAYHELGDPVHYQAIGERLLALRPDDPDVMLPLAAGYMQNMRPALMIKTLRRFLQRWPDHHEAENARKTIQEVEPTLREAVSKGGLTGDDWIDLAALHEEAQSLLQLGRFSQARKVEGELLRRHPDFVPALNNISLTYRAEGDLEAAITTARRVLTVEPENVHAMANLTQYLVVSGQIDEAREWGVRIKGAAKETPDWWIKQAEALSYLGDDEGVIEAFKQAERSSQFASPYDQSLLYHLDAVALLRQGDEREARRRWQEALKLSPDMDVAQDILADLALPVSERNAPWAFSLRQWVPQRMIRDLASQAGRISGRGSEEAVARVIRSYLEQHPGVEALLPMLLDRGDPEARELAFVTARSARTPSALAALRDFALSQRGPDALRYQAAQAAQEGGLLPTGPTRMWLEGEWREVLLFSFELHDEPMTRHSRRVEQKMLDAQEAMEEGGYAEAERLYRQALELEPDAPDLRYNLAMACERQGRSAEAEAVVRELFERHPDYLFGRASMARLLTRAAQFAEAEALLEPLLSRKRFHYSDFAIFAATQIELQLARGQRESARSWLQMWAAADPDNQNLSYWRRRLGVPEPMRRLLG